MGMHATRKAQVTNRANELNSRSDGTLGIMFLRLLVTKVDEHAIAEEPRNQTAEVPGNIGACPVDGAHDLALVFRVGVDRGGQSADLACQDAQLTALSQARAAARLHHLRLTRRWRGCIGVLHACPKFVTRTGNGDDEARGFAIWLNLTPQPCHEHVYAAVVGLMITARDCIAQLIAREDPPAPTRKQRQKLELRVRERQFASVLVNERVSPQIE